MILLFLQRIAFLLALSLVLAAGHAFIEPAGMRFQWSQPAVEEDDGTEEERDAATGGQPEGEQAPSPRRGTAGWALQHYNDGTALFVDARLRRDFEEGHVSGAFHLPFEAFLRGRPDVLDILPEDFLLIIYCEGGDCDSSHRVEQMLRQFGYTELHVFRPGYPALVEAGIPTADGPPEFF